VVAWDDFKEHGSVKDVKAAGKFRLEGKEYLVKEGDLIIIRHNA
jgi:ribosome-binding ATPase YchF (GTP1/OBG family)